MSWSSEEGWENSSGVDDIAGTVLRDVTPAANPQMIVVGAGGAGLYTAICAARAGARVSLVSATPLAGASSYWAQGGLAAALSTADSPDLHLADTLTAGRDAVRLTAAEVLVREAPDAVEDLARLGVRFDADRHGHLALGLEGGHSARRIVHAGGAATGRRIIRQLSALAAQEPNIEVLEDRRVTGLVVHEGRCEGILTLEGESVTAPATVLATGGAAALWLRTTNPAGAVGSGLILAHDAGASLADLEFMQFHPTAVVSSNGADGFLVTEAVRGEGAHLLDATGERFVDELAPRDEVARAVQQLMAATGAASVDLDMRHVDPALFPNVVSALRRAGIDPEHELVPVAPAAHYMMGGIAVDLDGRSTVPGLFAVGECACTGLHGANRLASNSLSECFVFGARAADAALSEPPVPRAVIAAATALSAPPVPALTDRSREALWRHAGLVREGAALAELEQDPHPLVRLIAAAALAREESRGSHQRLDFPSRDARLDHRHVVLPADGPRAIAEWR